MQASCSCHRLTAGRAAQSAPRSAPAAVFAARHTVALRSVYAHRGTTLEQQRTSSRSAAQLPALTVCRAAAAAKQAPPSAVAHLRYSRGSPSKVRRVLDQIRGKSYEEALMILEYTPYRACELIIKTLVSAGANAKENLGLKKLKLYISECYCDEGPQIKRIKTRAKGRANRISKLTNHITIRVQEKQA